MDNSVMYSISYGLYVLTAAEGVTINGCIINTFSQVTSTPNRVSCSVNKTNFTHSMIMRTKKFNVSIIDETADFELFKRFGFSTGRFENKLHRYAFIRAENNIPYIPNSTCGYISCEVVQTVDLGTHTMFIADVAGGKKLSDNTAMTYSYYHMNVKPKPAARAEKKADSVRYVCKICGYVYEGEISGDFICPVCKHPASEFERA